MKKTVFFLIGGVLAATVGALGVVYAWSPGGSDVSRPEVTPQTGFIKYQAAGSAMSPTIRDHDWLLVKSDTAGVTRGDVIVLHYPKDVSKTYCRRVVAVAGDRVVMRYFSNVKQTTVYSPEHPEGVVFPQGVTPHGNAYGQYEATVGSGMLYVVGDNTAPGASYDSDEWGLLPVTDVAGIVKQRLSPDPLNF